MAQKIISYWDLLSEIDKELERIGWSVNRARLYIWAVYQKRSRHRLTDAQLLEFWDYLKSLPDG